MSPIECPLMRTFVFLGVKIGETAGDLPTSLSSPCFVPQSEFSSPAMDDNTVIGNVIAKGGGRWEWIIPAFSTLPRRPDAYFNSPNFDGSNWWMRIFPNGIINTRIRIGLFSKLSLKVNYSSCIVGVKRANHSEETIDSKFCANEDYYDYAFNTTRRELEEGGWLPDGQLTVTIFFRDDHASQGNILQLAEFIIKILDVLFA